MYDKFAKALQKVNQRAEGNPLTGSQLFNMLLDYGAFERIDPIKFLVRTLIDYKIWNQITESFNSRNDWYNVLPHLKQKISSEFGFSENIIQIVFKAIENVDDWDNNWNPSGPLDNIFFEGIRICGSSITFREQLRDKGYVWDEEQWCFKCRYRGFDDCEIRINESYKYEPVSYVTITFPKSVELSKVKKICEQLEKEEILRRDNTLLNDIKRDHILCGAFYCTKDEEGTISIHIRDYFGMGEMAEAPIYSPENNLTIVY